MLNFNFARLRLPILLVMFFALACVAHAVVTECVSVNSAGEKANNFSFQGAISSGGRYVVFSSYAANLVSGDTNGYWDVFVFDRRTGITERVSVSSGSPGTEANGNSSEISPSDDGVFELPAISADGRYAVFSSSASNLVPGDTNGTRDIFVRDRVNHTTIRVSVSSSGAETNNFCYYPTISADGSRVVYLSLADNLVGGDTNGAPDVFLRDIPTGQTYRVNLSSAPSNSQAIGQEAWGSNPIHDNDITACISGDGLHVAFVSSASNLVPGDFNDYDVFVRDLDPGNLASGTTECVHVSTTGEKGNDFPWAHASYINYDGSVVTFSSYADNLVANDTNNDNDVFVRDRNAGTTTILSNTVNGEPGNAGSSDPTISADGNLIAFTSEATNLVTPPGTGAYDSFLVNRDGSELRRVAIDSTGVPLPGHSALPVISPDGRYAILANFPSFEDLSSAGVILIDTQAVTISDAKKMEDDSDVIVGGGVVTAEFDTAFYLQHDGIAAPAQACGIRVEWPGAVQAGKRYVVTGKTQTNGDGERYVLASDVEPITSEWNTEVKPVGLSPIHLGGSDFHYDPPSTAGQRGVTGGAGLNNIGQYVKTWGRCSYVDSSTLVIDSGSAGQVICKLPSTIIANPGWQNIAVTGVSSIFKSGETYNRLLLVTGVEPVTPVIPEGITGRWEAVITSGSASGSWGMLIVQSGESVTGTFAGSPISNGRLEGNLFTGTCVIEDDVNISISLTLDQYGVILSGTLTDTNEGEVIPFTFNKLSSEPVSPYAGHPMIVSANYSGGVIEVTWDRPVNGFDRDIVDYTGRSVVSERSGDSNSYDPGTFTYRMPVLFNQPLPTGLYTVLMESSEGVEWHDPYGAPAWDDPAYGYSFTFSFQQVIYNDKRDPNGTPITLDDVIVSDQRSDRFYVQKEDRTWGIQVIKPGTYFQPGQHVRIVGIIYTAPNGERYISAQEAVALDLPLVTLRPIALSNRALGGGNFRYSSVSGRGQAGVAGGVGLNNIGLLVRITGAVTRIDDQTFTIDDGSGVSVTCTTSPKLLVNSSWQYVVVTGISSFTQDGSRNRRIRVTKVDPIITGPSEPLTGCWESTNTSGEPIGVYGMLLVQQGETVTGMFRGCRIQNGSMINGVFTGSFQVLGYEETITFTCTQSGDTLTCLAHNVDENEDYNFVFQKISTEPRSPYTGQPKVVSASFDGSAITVTWDRPVNGWDYDIIDPNGNSILGNWDGSGNTYDPLDYVFHLPVELSTSLVPGSTYTIKLECGDEIDWYDPYGVPAWNSEAGGYTFTYTHAPLSDEEAIH